MAFNAPKKGLESIRENLLCPNCSQPKGGVIDLSQILLRLVNEMEIAKTW